MAVSIQGGAAIPVQSSNQPPDGGPAIPIAVVSDGRNVEAGPARPIVEVSDNRARIGGAALPVVVSAGNGYTLAGPPMPVYVVSGSLPFPTPLLAQYSDIGVTTSVVPFSGTGTITQSGTAVTGVGTAFLSEVVIGDRVSTAGNTINGIVTAITDNTHLTLSTSATVAVGVAFTITPQTGTARVTISTNQGSGGGSFTASGLARPVRRTDSNGIPYFAFNNVNNAMTGPNIADNLSSFTVIVVTRNVDYNEAYVLAKHDLAAEGNGWYIDYGGLQGNLEQDGTVNSRRRAYFAADVTHSQVYAHQFINYDETVLYYNGVDLSDDHTVNGTVTTIATTQPLMLGVAFNTFAAFDFYAAELYYPALTDAQIIAQSAVLASRFMVPS